MRNKVETNNLICIASGAQLVVTRKANHHEKVCISLFTNTATPLWIAFVTSNEIIHGESNQRVTNRALRSSNGTHAARTAQIKVADVTVEQSHGGSLMTSITSETTGIITFRTTLQIRQRNADHIVSAGTINQL